MRKNHLFVVALCISLMASVSFVPVGAQAQPNKSFRFLKNRADVSNLMNLVKRQKITFKKLGWENKAGARGKNASDKVTFTNSKGEKISLAPDVAFAQLNKLEQKLNAGGYSVRTAKALELTATTKYNAASMLTQHAAFKGALTKNVKARVLQVPGTMRNLRMKRGARGKAKFKRLNAMSQRFNVVNRLATSGSRGKKSSKKSSFNKEWPKSYAWGQKKYVQMAVNGKLKVFGTSDKLTIRGEGKVTASAINKTTTVFSVVASLTGNNKTDTVSGSLTARVLGMDSPVIDESFKKKTPKPIKDDWKKTLDWNVPIKIPIIWGISVKGEFGIRGKVGVEYSLIVHPLRVSASFVPYTELSGYGQAGVAIGVFGIDLAEAGLGAELTFLKGNLEFHAEAGLSVQNKTLYFDYNAFSRWDVQALRGVIYGYLKYWAPPCYNPFKGRCWKWDKKTKRADFWNTVRG